MVSWFNFSLTKRKELIDFKDFYLFNLSSFTRGHLVLFGYLGCLAFLVQKWIHSWGCSDFMQLRLSIQGHILKNDHDFYGRIWLCFARCYRLDFLYARLESSQITKSASQKSLFSRAKFILIRRAQFSKQLFQSHTHNTAQSKCVCCHVAWACRRLNQ